MGLVKAGSAPGQALTQPGHTHVVSISSTSITSSPTTSCSEPSLHRTKRALLSRTRLPSASTPHRQLPGRGAMAGEQRRWVAQGGAAGGRGRQEGNRHSGRTHESRNCAAPRSVHKAPCTQPPLPHGRAACPRRRRTPRAAQQAGPAVLLSASVVCTCSLPVVRASASAGAAPPTKQTNECPRRLPAHHRQAPFPHRMQL